MYDLAQVLLGAALVAFGILASALADRIRGIRLTREVSSPGEHEGGRRPVAPDGGPRHIDPIVHLRTPAAPKPQRPHAASKDDADGADDVIAALVATGYKKPVATEAVQGCSAAERATVEDWTRAALVALRRSARGGIS